MIDAHRKYLRYASGMGMQFAGNKVFYRIT